MRTVVVALIGVVAFASGVMLGFKLDADGAPEPAAVAGLPTEVEATRAAVLEAAESGDYDALAGLIPDGFKYSFGGPVKGGAVAYWQELERTSGKSPLDALAAILRMPYVLSRGTYVWPWVYTVENTADLSAHERELLAPLGKPAELVVDGTGYLSWRAGIAPDGTWMFFVAGD